MEDVRLEDVRLEDVRLVTVRSSVFRIDFSSPGTIQTIYKIKGSEYDNG